MSIELKNEDERAVYLAAFTYGAAFGSPRQFVAQSAVASVEAFRAAHPNGLPGGSVVQVTAELAGALAEARRQAIEEVEAMLTEKYRACHPEGQLHTGLHYARECVGELLK